MRLNREYLLNLNAAKKNMLKMVTTALSVLLIPLPRTWFCQIWSDRRLGLKLTFLNASSTYFDSNIT